MNGCFSEKSMFFLDSQLMHGPMMPIFESVRAIPSTDLVQTFERDPLIGSQVRVHTNIKKKTKKKKAKTDAAKINTFRKTKFLGSNKLRQIWA